MMSKNYFIGALAALSIFIIFPTCEIGLGESVDTETPTVKIITPGTSEVLRGSINLSGSWSDDKSVNKLVVNVTNVDKEQTVINGAIANLTANGSWNYQLYSQTSVGAPSGAIILPDGKYEAKVAAYDSVGHSSGEASRTFEIDGTPPVVALSKPASINISSPSTYGRTVKITGLISDDHAVPTIKIAVYKDDDSLVQLAENGGKDTFTDFDPSDTSVIIAKYYTADQLVNISTSSEEYKLYQNYLLMFGDDIKTDSRNESKNLTIVITAIDKAGNESERVFLKTNLLNLVQKKAGQTLEIADLKNILNGTYKGSIQNKDVIKDILNGEYEIDTTITDETQIERPYFSDSDTKLVFSINPDANPTYEFRNYTYDTSFTEIEEAGILTLLVNCGLDGTSFYPKTLGLRITRIDKNLTFSDLDAKFISNGQTENDTNGVSLDDTATTEATYSVDLGKISTYINDNYVTDSNSTYKDFIESGKTYKIEVTGKDGDGNEFIPFGNKKYGFLVKASTSSSEIECNLDNTYQKAENLSTTKYIPIIVTDDSVNASVTINAWVKYYYDCYVDEDEDIKQDANKITLSANPYIGTRKEINIPINDIKESNTNFSNCTIKLTVESVKTGAKTKEKSFIIYADNTAPALKFTNKELGDTSKTIYVFDNESYYVDNDNKKINGNYYYGAIVENTYSLNGTWEDRYSYTTTSDGVTTTKYGNGSGGKQLYYKIDSGEWKKISEEDSYVTKPATWSLDLKNTDTVITEGEHTITFKTEDAVGNIKDTYKIEKIIFDFSKPTITLNQTIPKYVKSNGMEITGTYNDTYGIESFTVIAKKDESEVQTGNLGYTFTDDRSQFSFTIKITPEGISSDGTWTFDISAIDKAGRTRSLDTYTTVVDTQKPVWQVDTLKVNKIAYSYTDENTHSWYKASALPFAGTLTEAVTGSGIKEIIYSVTNADSTYEDSFATTKDKNAEGNYTGTESFSVNLGEFITSKDAPNIVSMKAVDYAGNESDVQLFRIYVDSESPTFTSDQSGTEVTNGEKDIKASGTFDDDASGVKSVTLEISYTENGTKKTVEISGTDAIPATLDSANKTWSYTIPAANLTADALYSVKATVEDNAGNKSSSSIFSIQKDSAKPEFKTPAIESTSTKYSVYNSEGNTYYINNTDGTFTISGTATDNFGIDYVELKIEGKDSSGNNVTMPAEDADDTEKAKYKVSNGVYSFSNINLSALRGDITATLSVMDKAGNSSAEDLVLTLKIDTSAPKGIHAIDGADKDIFFRMGDNNNDDEVDTLTDDDKKVGGKYSVSTYGNDQTIRIRGAFSDAGCGVDMVYYKVISSGATEKSTTELETAANTFLINYKNDDIGTGYFKTIKAEEKRVFYTPLSSGKVYDTNGDEVALSGTDTIYKGFVKDDTASGTKRYAKITNNFDNVFSGFDSGHNYLILVAVDKVGNAQLDSVNVVTGTTKTLYSNFTVNVDTTAPEAKPDSDEINYANKAGNFQLSGIAKDEEAGIKSVTIKLNNHEIPVTLSKALTATNDYGTLSVAKNSDTKNITWSVNFISSKVFENADNKNYAIELTITDNAGKGNTNTVSVGNVILDTVAPVVTLNDPSDADSTTAGIQVNGTITLSGSITDANLLPSPAITGLQYVQSETAPAADSTAWTNATGVTCTGNYTYSITGFDTTNLTDTKKYYLRAVARDKAGNIGYSTAKEVTVNQDSDRPIVELLNLNFADVDTDKNYLKGTTTSTTSLTINVTDDDGVDTIEYSLNGTAESPTWNSYARGISGLSEGENTVYFRITDKSGKTFTTAAEDTEKTIGSTSYNISNQPVITGTRVSKDTNGNDVIKTIKTGTVQLDFNVVTKKPEISEVKYSYYNSKTNTWSDFAETLRTMGGIYTKLKVQLKAKSAQAIKEVKATYSGDTAVNGALPKYNFTCADNSHDDANAHVWTSAEIAVGSVTSAQTIIVTVYDKVPDPMTEEKDLTVKIDNTAPGLEIQSPSGTTELSLEQTVRGAIKETSTLYYAVSRVEDTEEDIATVTPNSDSEDRKNGTTVLATKWTQIEDDTSSGTWYVYFDETYPNNSEAHAPKFATYLTEEHLGITTKAAIVDKNNPYTTLTPIYFWIKAVDDCGNESINHRRFTIDPQGENPTVEITDPTNDDDGNPPTLGGSIKIKGSADDNNEPKYVWVQIDSDETAGFKLADLQTIFNVTDKTGKKVYKLGKITENTEITSLSGITDANATDYGIMIELAGTSTSKRWTLSINDNQEFDPTGSSGKRTLNITVLATDQDDDGTIHISPAKSQTVIIDANNPYFDDNSLKLVKYDANGTQQTYSAGINVKGIWYLTGKLKDADSGLKEIKYKGTKVVSASGEDYTDPHDANLWFKHVAEDGTKTKSDGTKEKVNNYTFSIPLGNSTSGTVGTDEALIHIVENTDTGLWAERTFSVNYDNKAPEFITSGSSFVKLDSQVQNSSGFYTFGALATEDSVTVNGTTISQTGVERIAFYFTRDLDYSLKEKYPATYLKHGSEHTNDLFDVMIYHSNKEDGSENDDVNSGNMIVNYKGSNSGLTQEDGLYWKTISGSITSNTTFTYSGNADPNIHKRGLVKINGVIYLITGVSGNTVTIDGNIANGSIEAKFAVCNIIDYSGEKNSGSISLNKGYGYGYYPSRDSDDGDLITETFNSQGTEWIFDAAINSKNLPDGPITLHMVAFDKAGNASEEWTSTNFVVSNNAPRIAGMRIGTDENGNGIVDESEFNATYSGKYELGYENGDSEKPVTEVEFPVQTTSTPKSLLTVKGRTIVKPEIVGGNGTISYVYGIQTYSNNSWGEEKTIISDTNKVALGSGTTDAVAELDDIDLTLDHFIGTTNEADTEEIPDGINRFIFSFGDSTPGKTSTDSISNNAKLKVIMNVALRETNKAKNYILPIYWNKDDDNSLFKQSKEQGHIELAKDWILASGYDASKAEMDADPKVSGKIKLEGIAQDDTLLNQIIVKLSKNLGTSGFTANSDLVIATYDRANATWDKIADVNSIGTTGWAAKIQKATYGDLKKAGIITEYPVVGGIIKKESDELPYTSQDYGHVVHWILYLDTEQIDGISATDVTVTATANDRGSPKWSTSANEGAGDAVFTPNTATVTGTGYSGAVTKSGTSVTEGALTGSYKLDVVPYITGIETDIPDDFARSASGAYSVYYDADATTGETITIQGFNLVRKTGETVTKPTVSVGSNALTVGTYTANSVTAVITDSVTSGQLMLTSATGYETLNNVNKNPTLAAGSSKMTETSHYNSQANGTNNDRLTDDVELKVWELGNFVDTADITSPMMKMDSASKWYMSYGYGVPNMYVNNNGTTTRVDYSWNKFHNTNVAFDDSGKIYAVATNTDRENDTKPANFAFYSRSVYVNNGNRNYQNSWIGKTRLEKVYNEEIYKIDRVPRPKIAISGDESNTKVLIAYFDNNSSGKEVKLRYGTLDSSNSASGQISDYSTAQIVANIDSIYQGGAYAAVGIVPSGTGGATKDIALVAWYDAQNKQLMYSYNDNTDLTSSVGSTDDSNIWQQNAKVIGGKNDGWFVDMAVDGDGGIHLAYYTTGTGDLKYAYIPQYNSPASEIKVVTVDSYQSVGTQISISVRNDGTAGAANYVPYISYYNGSNDQTMSSVRIAWRNSSLANLGNGVGMNGTKPTDRATGLWEYMTVPCTSVPDNAVICNGVPTSGSWGGTIVLGFKSDEKYVRAVLK